MSSVAIIVAAGSGERLKAGMPKALVELCGKTLLQWSLQALRAVPGIEQIVVALPAGTDAPADTIGVRGGLTRSESVKAALDAAPQSELVLVHDAARPLLTPELAQAVLAAATKPGVDGAVAAAQVVDTVKRASNGVVCETLQRSQLWAVQTPQAFKSSALRRALSAPVEVLRNATDDASLIEREGGTIAIVPSSAENMKVTTALDLDLAALLLQRRKPD